MRKGSAGCTAAWERWRRAQGERAARLTYYHACAVAVG